MPAIEISDKVFAGLQALAVPFIDTPNDVIAKLLQGTVPSPEQRAPDEPISVDVSNFPAENIPSLKFAVVKSYVVDGKTHCSGVYWSTLIAEILCACAKRGVGSQALVQAMKTPVCLGKSDAAGYQFVSDAGVSFQQLNSDRSFEQAYLLAKLARVPFEVTWRWGNDAKAAHPGKMGRSSYL